MNAEIVMIGTELLLGQIVDSNAAHIGRVLAENGIGLYLKTTVGDNRRRIADVLRAALDRSDVVLTSGGLGPTEDDLTREAVSDVFGLPLETRPELLDELEARFAFLRRPITENNRKQAMAPRGATIIPNPNGTAPGIICGDERGEIICMPGVPHELYAMLSDSVVPYLRQKHGMDHVIHHRVLKVCGVGESWVDSKMGDLMAQLENPKIGVLASPDVVRIRISARADSVEAAERMIDEVDAMVRARLPGLIMGVNDETLEGVLGELFDERGWTLAVLETFTGGMVAQRLTAAGFKRFAGGLIEPMEVPAGSDPKSVALTKAERAREMFHADCGLGAATSLDDKVVHVAFVTPTGATHWDGRFPTVDGLWQLRASIICLERMRRSLIEGTR